MSTLAVCSAHQAFIELTEAFYCQAGCELAYFDSDPGEPIAFEATVGEVKFSVGYDPSAGDTCLFVYCAFGVPPVQDREAALLRLLQLNPDEARLHNGTYCVEPGTQEVAYYLRASTADMDVAGLQEQLGRIAMLATQWRQDPLDQPLTHPEPVVTDRAAASWLPFV